MISFFGSPEWNPGKLQDLVLLQRGFDITKAEQKPGEVQVFSSSGPNSFHNVAKVEGPGVIIGRKGTLGSVFYSDRSYWPHDTTLWSKDLKGNNAKFVYYALQRIDMTLFDTGAANPTLNRNHVHNLPIFIPERSTQDRIAAILSAYDDLIENNRRRIVLLEELARQLHKEWFVRFGFPGHEHIKIIDGVPEGWESMELADCVEIVKDTADPKSLEPDTPYIGLEHLPRRSITLSEWETAEKVESGKFRFLEKDIIFGKIRPYFHKVGFTLLNGITSSDAIVMRPKNAAWWACVLMEVSSDRFVALASQTVKEGSKMPRANWDVLKKHVLALPPEGLRQTFNEQIEAIAAQTKSLSLAIAQAAKARDLLLPKLMSGAIAV